MPGSSKGPAAIPLPGNGPGDLDEGISEGPNEENDKQYGTGSHLSLPGIQQESLQGPKRGNVIQQHYPPPENRRQRHGHHKSPGEVDHHAKLARRPQNVVAQPRSQTQAYDRHDEHHDELRAEDLFQQGPLPYSAGGALDYVMVVRRGDLLVEAGIRTGYGALHIASVRLIGGRQHALPTLRGRSALQPVVRLPPHRVAQDPPGLRSRGMNFRGKRLRVHIGAEKRGYPPVGGLQLRGRSVGGYAQELIVIRLAHNSTPAFPLISLSAA